MRNMKGIMHPNLVIIATVTLTLAGCAVGPNYRQPDAPNAKDYTAAPLPTETASAPGQGGAAQRLVSGKEIPSQWWTLFHSESLDRLIRDALEYNPTLASAQATLRQTQENANAFAGSTLYPRVDANASASRQKISGVALGQPNFQISPFTLYNASVSVSYALDFFGSTKRELEALRSQVDYQGFQLEGAYLTITGNIVTTAIKEGGLRAQIQATQEIISAQDAQFKLIERQFELGAATRSDVLAQQTQLAQTQATLPPLERQLAQTRNQLAVLNGRYPSESGALPEFDLEGLHLPEELPVSLPSLLVRQRPDVRASEAVLHAASAEIGVATANLYPKITLTAGLGSVATTPNSLFKSGTGVWNFGAGLTQPLFQGGALKSKRRAAVAAYEGAEAQYRLTVLQAFQNVADVLQALEADARTLKAQATAEAAARDTLDLTEKQYRLGAVSYLSLLNAERSYQQARIALIQAQAARYADTAALFQALGGGWWNRTTDTDTVQKTSTIEPQNNR
jgi:NodT family efflux transporter outer membrane factor (OMF) lipoprotein